MTPREEADAALQLAHDCAAEERHCALGVRMWPFSGSQREALNEAQRKAREAFTAADLAEDRAVAAGYPDRRLQEYG